MAENGTDLTELLDVPLNVPGLIAIIIFYVFILAIGVFASCRKKTWKKSDQTSIMVAGREIGICVGIFTMTATWVGGGYINGTAEVVFNPDYGLVWTQAPFGFAISLILGGIFFAKKMRKAGYVTMLDPIEEKFGGVMTALLYLPALLGELLWTAAILSALGASLSVVLGLDQRTAIIVSAGIAVFYTLLGGLYSVAFTDVVQLACIFIGLWLCVPFALLHPAVTPLPVTAAANTTWLGSLKPDPWIGNWIDSALLLIGGGIPWQVYFQRVLSARTARGARNLSYVAGIGCALMAIPAVLVGAIGASTDWNATDYRYYGVQPIPSEDFKLILPLVLQYLCPKAVGVIGLGAVSAAVMSSADSSVLSSSSMFARNVYAPFRRLCGKVSDREILWVMRIAILLVGACACVLAIVIKSIYGLFYLCADLVYVILLPQLVCVLYFKHVNVYGSFIGFVAGCFFRLTGGEPLITGPKGEQLYPPLIEYPWYDFCKPYQCFPFKTMSMVISLLCVIVFSLLAKWCCKALPEGCDCAHAFRESWDLQDQNVNIKGDFVRETMDGQGQPNLGFHPDNSNSKKFNQNYL